MSKILQIYNESAKVHKDYLVKRAAIKLELDTVGWAATSNDDKYVIIRTYLEDSAFDTPTNNANKVQFLMSVGYMQPQASLYLATSYAKHHALEKEASVSRANSIKITEIVAKYLTISDARDFIETTKILYDLYKDESIKGVDDGSVGEGLFDFIMSTPLTSYENAGLEQQLYVLNMGNWNSFRAELMAVLRDGIY